MAVMAAVLLYGMILAAQPGEAGSLPAGAPLVEERLAAVRNAPTDPRARLELGLAYLQAEEYEFAMAELIEAIQLNPDNKDNLSAQANYHLGAALLAIDRPALAISAFREALRLGWTDVGVYLALGQALTAQGKFDDAIVHYREALRLAPDARDAYAGLGLAFEGSGRVDEAITNYERYLQSAPPAEEHSVDAIKRRLAKLKERRKM
jgi:tetratricopeptide (TPR) repeat protein